jgi:predicted secreted protein
VSWASGIVVYFLIWWVVLFAVLPWGVQVPEKSEPGHAPSAPVRPRLWIKAAVTTVVAGLLWLGYYWLYQSGWIEFRPNP